MGSHSNIMGSIHFVGGEKGGVGKSMVARLLAQNMIDRQIPFLGFDTDQSHGALLRFYSDFASKVVVNKFESLDAIMEAAVSAPEKRILVDLAAQTHDLLVKWMDESGVLEMAADLGITVRYWHVMDTGRDSVDLLKKLLDRFGPRLEYVLVLNQLRGDHFDIFEKSPEKKKAVDLGAQIISIKRLHETVVTKIDAASSSFWAAQNVAERTEHSLGLLERQRVKIWMRNAYSEIETIAV